MHGVWIMNRVRTISENTFIFHPRFALADYAPRAHDSPENTVLFIRKHSSWNRSVPSVFWFEGYTFHYFFNEKRQKSISHEQKCTRGEVLESATFVFHIRRCQWAPAYFFAQSTGENAASLELSRNRTRGWKVYFPPSTKELKIFFFFWKFLIFLSDGHSRVKMPSKQTPLKNWQTSAYADR